MYEMVEPNEGSNPSINVSLIDGFSVRPKNLNQFFPSRYLLRKDMCFTLIFIASNFDEQQNFKRVIALDKVQNYLGPKSY